MYDNIEILDRIVRNKIRNIQKQIIVEKTKEKKEYFFMFFSFKEKKYVFKISLCGEKTPDELFTVLRVYPGGVVSKSIVKEMMVPEMVAALMQLAWNVRNGESPFLEETNKEIMMISFNKYHKEKQMIFEYDGDMFTLLQKGKKQYIFKLNENGNFNAKPETELMENEIFMKRVNKKALTFKQSI